MLYVLLVLSLVLLITATYAARGENISLCVFLACVLVFPSFQFSLILLAVFCQFLALGYVILVIRLASPFGKWLAFPLAVLITAIIYGIVGQHVEKELLAFERLRERYPYESMEMRLPESGPLTNSETLSASAEKRLKSFDESTNHVSPRAAMLSELHTDTFEKFVNTLGFGIGRLSSGAIEFNLRSVYWEKVSVPQPASRAIPAESNGGDSVRPTPVADDALHTMHKEGAIDFVNIWGFGLVTDRQHVAGFLPHGFSEVPKPTERWSVETIDLVGLLLHPDPVAYVSADLPRMDELKKAPTRTLDAFEALGLDQLRHGEDLVTGDAGETLRMLGAVRSVRACVKCHGGQRGDLLGAFSYTLRHTGQ